MVIFYFSDTSFSIILALSLSSGPSGLVLNARARACVPVPAFNASKHEESGEDEGKNKGLR